MSVNINKTVQLFLQEIPNINGKRIAVGYSAGADSTVLLHIMKEKSKHFNFQLDAVFFSHCGSPINEGEDNNLILAKKLCSEMSINLIDVELNLVKTSKKSWEQLGRTGRLNFYKTSDYDMIFLGHHQDDQNETTMMQIFRGGGKGSSAMKPIDGKYYRPMLNVSKDDIYKYLEDRKIPWIEDPTNTNIDFTRNYWRKVGLPTISTHYPNYSVLLETFRKKNTNLNQISFDMAQVDGLTNFLAGDTVNISNIPEYRLQNLILHAFPFIGSSVENNKIENLIKIGKANNESQLEVGDYMINLNNKNLSLFSLQNKKTNKIKP
ncbi:tRNA lysidine(34) synthetase TilS [archaeon]|nr:tRNA lysidine(34) synthetase TilS [archaeon]